MHTSNCVINLKQVFNGFYVAGEQVDRADEADAANREKILFVKLYIVVSCKTSEDENESAYVLLGLCVFYSCKCFYFLFFHFILRKF